MYSVDEGRSMKFALHFASTNFPDAGGAKRVAMAAEAAGFESVLAIEHVVWPTRYASTYPYSPTGRLPGGPETQLPDPLIWMAFAAAATSRLRFMTGVLILPQRNPVVLAKEVATLDFMSGGRVDLGIGVGWIEEEFAALGVPFAHRGRRADEAIQAMRALWARDDASFQGEYVAFHGMSCNPKPARGRVPIVIGGHSAAAARRAGRLGDGFFPATGAQVDIKPLIGMEDGVIVALGTARTRAKSYTRIVELMRQRLQGAARIKAAFTHCAALDKLEVLKGLVTSAFDCAEVLTSSLSPVLAVHSGPGTVGVSYYPE